MLKYIIITIFLIFSCSENSMLEENNKSSNKRYSMIVGNPCNNNCIWSSYAVSMNIQEGNYDCKNVKCSCVKVNDAYTSCNPATLTSVSREDNYSIPTVPYYNQYENKFYGYSTCQNTSIAMVVI